MRCAFTRGVTLRAMHKIALPLCGGSSSGTNEIRPMFTFTFDHG
jgi:hypothetical protein